MHRLRSPSAPRLLPSALLLLGLLLAAPGDAADSPRIYKWIDSNGIAHYTTDPARVPKALRRRIEAIDRAAPSVTVETPPPAVADETSPPAVAEETPAPTPDAAPEAAPERPAVAVPTPASTPSEAWATRDALPRLRRGSSVLAEGEATPAQREALAAERAALETRIAEVEAAIRSEENALKDLITDPELDKETPLFDRPEFLEVSRRLPELQAQLEELRGQREQLGTP